MHVLNRTIYYWSPRYKKGITVPLGYLSDGATWAADIESNGWWVHDWICGNYLGSGPNPIGGRWSDSTLITNWQASTVLSDIMWSEGGTLWREGERLKATLRRTRAVMWWLPTWLFGGGKARDNGMW